MQGDRSASEITSLIKFNPYILRFKHYQNNSYNKDGNKLIINNVNEEIFTCVELELERDPQSQCYILYRFDSM